MNDRLPVTVSGPKMLPTGAARSKRAAADRCVAGENSIGVHRGLRYPQQVDQARLPAILRRGVRAVRGGCFLNLTATRVASSVRPPGSSTAIQSHWV